MASALAKIPIRTSNNKHTLTPLEQAFISSYIICKNATQAVVEAGYKCKAPNQYGSALLARDYIAEEITYRLQQIEDAKVAKPTEILQFYSSVMRGEILDQFGIEASLDTRIKAANELAKHQIEIPMKLQQKQNDNLGSITINFTPRQEE
jgi:phage terminase small subunit